MKYFVKAVVPTTRRSIRGVVEPVAAGEKFEAAPIEAQEYYDFVTVVIGGESWFIHNDDVTVYGE